MMKVLEDITFIPPMFFSSELFTGHFLQISSLSGCEIHTLFWTGFSPSPKIWWKNSRRGLHLRQDVILINSAASAASAAEENSAWSRTLAMSLGRNTFLLSKKRTDLGVHHGNTQKEIKLMCFLNLMFFLTYLRFLVGRVLT